MNSKLTGNASSPKLGFAWLAGLLGLVFIAISLRPPVAVVGPLLDQIDAGLGLGVTWSAVLASAPVFCFGVGAFLGPALAKRFGLHRAMLIVLLVLGIAVGLRAYVGSIGLLLGTIAVGLAIAVGNVLLPTVVRTDYPNRIAAVTGVYTTLLALSASFAASTAVPWAQSLGGWQPALTVWVAPVAIAFALWLSQLKRSTVTSETSTASHEASIGKAVERSLAERAAVRKSPITWYLVAFFGLQSLGFYALLGWLPAALVSAGLTPAVAGGMLGLATAFGIPFGLALSIIVRRFKSLAIPAALASLITTAGFLLVGMSLRLDREDLKAPVLLASALMSLGQASTFPLSLALIGSRAGNQSQTTLLSALSQGWGYLLAGAGTFIVGILAEATGSFEGPMYLLAALSAVQVWAGYQSGRPGQIAAQ